LSPLVEPSVSLVEHMEDGQLEGIVLKDRASTYRDGTRVGWSKVKGPQLGRALGVQGSARHV
jgi:ATP-dependent DNA ligase